MSKMLPQGLPLMRNNITRRDLDAVIAFLADDPILTQSAQVKAFEREWSEWLGVKHSVFVNSGSSANLLTMFALREKVGLGEVIVPTLTWVSDIASVLQAGFTPVFVDVDPETLGMDIGEVLAKLTSNTKAVFITHILGFNALTRELLDELSKRNVLLIEDVCESHGAVFNGRKLGSIGFASNFSFYYAHHMSTIEGGMICTNDDHFYEDVRMLRSHGMVREIDDPELKNKHISRHPDLNPDFIFKFPAFNVRSSEINAVIGRSQLKRLDENNELRKKNLNLFLENIDKNLFYTDFRVEGSCNYAFTLILREPDTQIRNRLEAVMSQNGIEYRRGTSGGGNQLRQPYLRQLFGESFNNFPNVEHIHFYGYYIGNFPSLSDRDIYTLCEVINSVGDNGVGSGK